MGNRNLQVPAITSSQFQTIGDSTGTRCSERRSHSDSSTSPEGPWWKTLLASPAKKLGWNPFKADATENITPFTLPVAATPTEAPEVPEVNVAKVSEKDKKVREDLPKRISVQKVLKACLRNVVNLAMSKNAAREAMFAKRGESRHVEERRT